MARHSGAINPLVQKKLKEVSFILSDAINGNKINEEGLVVPREFVEKLLESYHKIEEFEKCESIKKFLDSKPSYVKNITAQEWMNDYLLK